MSIPSASQITSSSPSVLQQTRAKRDTDNTNTAPYVTVETDKNCRPEQRCDELKRQLNVLIAASDASNLQASEWARFVLLREPDASDAPNLQANELARFVLLREPDASDAPNLQANELAQMLLNARLEPGASSGPNRQVKV